MNRPLPLVAGNWKMNTTVATGMELADAICVQVVRTAVEVCVLPPFTHLVPVAQHLEGSGIGVAAQNCYSKQAGAYTGEVSPEMIRGVCDTVLIGHSERRHLLGESDELIADKLRAAREAGLRVILAVGETESERERGSTSEVIDRQLSSALEHGQDLGGDSLVVAYEPVWAIGTGRTATRDQAEEVCAHLAGQLAALAGDRRQIRILYGGSVTPRNAADLFAAEHIDGALVGGASLNADDFAAIVAAAETRLTAPAPRA